MNDFRLLHETVIPGGWNHSCIVRRGRALRLYDVEGGANVSALFYNAANFSERYDMGDTLKIQHISSLFKHTCIYSDMGRVLMSITEESLGGHDVICGTTYPEHIRSRFGELSYQQARNDFYRNGFDSLNVELAKNGMTKRDFTEVVNFFSKIEVGSDGSLSYAVGASKAGDFVELRAEMDTLVVLDTGMHPLNPSPVYLRKPVRVTLLECPPAAADDPCRRFCPENERGFINSANYYL
jgi:urea carboxylase-associated protein 2